jgi:hypothetical protein
MKAIGKSNSQRNIARLLTQPSMSEKEEEFLMRLKEPHTPSHAPSHASKLSVTATAQAALDSIINDEKYEEESGSIPSTSKSSSVPLPPIIDKKIDKTLGAPLTPTKAVPVVPAQTSPKSSTTTAKTATATTTTATADPTKPSAPFPSNNIVFGDPSLNFNSNQKWMSLYDTACSDKNSPTGKHNNAMFRWETALAVKKIAKFLRIKMENRIKLPLVTKSTKGLKNVEPLKTWNPKRTRNYLCERCTLPCPRDDVTCVHCNVVLHVQCLTKAEVTFLSNTSATDYICDLCLTDVSDENGWHEGEKSRLWHLENRRAKATLLTRVCRGHLQRREFTKTRKSMIWVQALFRAFLAKRHFEVARKSLRRIFIVNVLSVEDMPIANKDSFSADPYIVATAHDRSRAQMIRHDTSVVEETLSAEWENQHFIMPGINANASMVFTVIDDEQEVRRMCQFGQQHILLLFHHHPFSCLTNPFCTTPILPSIFFLPPGQEGSIFRPVQYSNTDQ